MKNMYSFDKLIYKGNINRDFYIFCLKRNKKLIKYIFIHLFYFIMGLLSNKFYLKYKTKYHNYLKNVNNLNKLYQEFYNKYKYKINKWYLNNYNKNNYIISNSPYDIVKLFIKDEKLIAPKFNKNFELENIKELKKDKFNNSYLTKIHDINNYDSEVMYLYKFGLFIPINSHHMKAFKIFGIILICLSLSFFLLLITFLSSTTFIDITMISSYFKDIRLILLNYLPILFLLLILLFATKRLWLSFSLTSILIFIISIINKTKLYYRDDVFIFEDIFLAKEAAVMTTRYAIIIRWYILVGIFISIFLIILLKRHLNKLNIKYRYSIVITILLILLSVFGYKKLYLNEELYNNLGDKSNINIWISTRQFQIRGLIYPFIHSSNNIFDTVPEGYNEKDAKNILNKYKYDDIEEDKKVNIISIMLEAYNDFSKFPSIEFTTDIYKPLHDIEKKSISGELKVDIFGGGTIVTEREYITGYILFPSFRRGTYSYAAYFKEQGYVTEAMHPLYGAFYNRNTANLNMGFDNYLNYENKFSHIQSGFMNDHDFYKYIIEGLENANKKGKKYFNFSVTYQNHGPYSTDKIDKYYIKNKGYSDNAFNMFNRYLDGINESNKALEELINYIDNYDEPVVLVFFGDHNPYLGASKYVYKELGIDMSLDNVDIFKNYYSTPYVIYGNSKAKKILNNNFVGKGNDVSPFFLMNEVFDNLGYKGNDYTKYTKSIKEKVDVIHSLYVKENGEYVLRNNSQYKDLIDEYTKVNYYYAHR